MAQFKGEYQESFVIEAPLERAKAHFSDLETIASHYGGLESWSQEGQTLRVVLSPKKVMKATYQGRYANRYSFPAENVLEWQSAGEGNADVSGRAEFVPVDDTHTRVNYRHAMTCDVEGVGRLVGKAISPVVVREIRNGVAGYLERMRTSLAA